jgi:YjjI family glycine radical enzyme
MPGREGGFWWKAAGLSALSGSSASGEPHRSRLFEVVPIRSTDEFARRSRDLITAPGLSYRQRLHQLALLAEDLVPYPKLSAEAEEALATGLVSDLAEGNAPYRPRYLLPDYQVTLRGGSEYLELEPATDLEDAITNLQILYHNVPSVTSYPVYFGDLDALLLPYLDDRSDAELDEVITRFWRFLDRTIPDGFAHANIGPTDNRIARSVLRVDASLAQVVPNLTFKYDPAVTPDRMLERVAASICAVNKPHIANHPMISSDFPEGYGVVSCYNTLPLGGGSHTMVRLNLAESARRHAGDPRSYLSTTLVDHVAFTFEVLETRIRFLVEESGFYDHSYLVREGLLHRDRFSAMFGIFGVAEMVAEFLGDEIRYGWDAAANELAEEVIAEVAALVGSMEVPHCRRGRALLHAQSGISDDIGVTAGARVATGYEPETVDHVLAVAPHHGLFPSGISDIFAVDAAVRANPQAIVDVTRGAFDAGMREMTFNVAGCDLVRVTGYMVRLSDIERLKREGSRIASTVLGAESVEHWGLLDRAPRVITHEFDPRPRR